MDFIPVYARYIEDQLQNYQLPSQPSNLYDPIRYFLAIGGKRMRSMLTLLGAELFDIDKSKAINAALAIEVLHNFTLIHDDIMDNAPLRRGNVTVHEKWDMNTAILSGDVMMIKAYHLLAQQEGDLREMMHVFNTIASEVCEGQQMDIDFESKPIVKIDEYIEMIRLKTSVLLGGALELAAIIADTTYENRKFIYDFGVNIGIAFQIQDDILDCFGDPEKFGKQVGGDIIENKKTLLYLLALEMATPDQRFRFDSFLQETNSTVKIKSITDLYEEIGVKNKCIEYQELFFAKAISALKNISVEENKISDLLNLSSYLINRTV